MPAEAESGVAPTGAPFEPYDSAEEALREMTWAVRFLLGKGPAAGTLSVNDRERFSRWLASRPDPEILIDPRAGGELTLLIAERARFGGAYDPLFRSLVGGDFRWIEALSRNPHLPRDCAEEIFFLAARTSWQNTHEPLKWVCIASLDKGRVSEELAVRVLTEEPRPNPQTPHGGWVMLLLATHKASRKWPEVRATLRKRGSWSVVRALLATATGDDERTLIAEALVAKDARMTLEALSLPGPNAEIAAVPTRAWSALLRHPDALVRSDTRRLLPKVLPTHARAARR